MSRTFFAAIIIGGLVLSSISFGYSGGSGTAENPYQIADVNDLLELAATTADYGKCFILTADIDMGGQVFAMAIIAADTSSSSGFQGKAFTGTFDGNGHKITNFTINGGSNSFRGLFGYIIGYINYGGSVKNLGLENCSVSGSSGPGYVGGLVGLNGGSISNCYSRGTVSGTGYVGGLVGYNGSSISNCYSTGAVSGSSGVGGLVGGNYGSISNCYSTGAVSGSYGVGGLVGLNVASISDCYSTGAVSGSSGSYSYNVGGLVGENRDGSISDCYSTGSVSGDYDVGGLVGFNDYATITNCYSTGSVRGNCGVGGLVGLNGTGTILSCYATGNVAGGDCIGGLVGGAGTILSGGLISCSFASGTVAGNRGIGGLVGELQGGEILDCYATVDVDGNDWTGGLIGGICDTAISYCYSSGRVSGDANNGGLVGYEYYAGSYLGCFWDSEVNPDVNGIGDTSDPNVIGKPTAEMKKERTFTTAGWDFVEIWGIGENQTYPFLRNEPAGDLDHDKKVDLLDLAILASHWLEGQ